MVTITEMESIVTRVREMPWQSDFDPRIDPIVYAEQTAEMVRKLVEQAAKEGIQKEST